jgi:hypothetical protein
LGFGVKKSSKSSNRLLALAVVVVEAGVGFAAGVTNADSEGIWEGFVDLVVGDVMKSENSSSSSIVG